MTMYHCKLRNLSTTRELQEGNKMSWEQFWIQKINTWHIPFFLFSDLKQKTQEKQKEWFKIFCYMITPVLFQKTN